MKKSNRIKQIRTDLRLTQVEFSKAIEISQPYLTQLENGDRGVTMNIAYAIFQKFGIPLKYTMGESDEIENIVSEPEIEYKKKNEIDLDLLIKTLSKAVDSLSEDNSYFKIALKEANDIIYGKIKTQSKAA